MGKHRFTPGPYFTLITLCHDEPLESLEQLERTHAFFNGWCITYTNDLARGFTKQELVAGVALEEDSYTPERFMEKNAALELAIRRF
jgi:hypothetical protein